MEPVQHYQYVSNISNLEIIKEPSVNIAIHKREIPEDIQQFLGLLIESNYGKWTETVSLSTFSTLFDDHFLESRSLHSEGYDLLKDDVVELINQFVKIFSMSSFKVVFGVAKTDMCTKFHIDQYDYRMLCTYSGKGTCWLKNDNINFDVISGFLDSDVFLRQEDIQYIDEKDVVILKGALAPNLQVGGVVHKSPMIEETGEKRIVLRIDGNPLPDNI